MLTAPATPTTPVSLSCPSPAPPNWCWPNFSPAKYKSKADFFHIIADVIQQPLTFVDKVAAQIIKNIKNRCIGPAERRFAGRNDVKSLRSVDGCTAADLRVTVIVINAVADRAGKRVFLILILGMIVFFLVLGDTLAPALLLIMSNT